ncbi:LysR family transcriptional regulator [Roseobacteraceae bacterium S113]
MTIRLLRTLVAVADHKTFSAAASAVHVTHAAVSQQMRSLEADLDVTLFDRSTRTPELTPLAHQIVAKARKLIADYDTLVPSVLGDSGLTGVVSLGVMRTTLTGLIPQTAATLKAQYPELSLHIRPGLTASLLADVERGHLDAAVISKPHLLPQGVVFRQLIEEPMHLIAAHGEPENDPLHLLATRPFIRFDRSAVVGALIEGWLSAQGLRVQEAMELDSPEAIASMVQANLGVSIVPDVVVKPRERITVKRLSLGPDAPRRVLGLAYRDHGLKAQALDTLYEALGHVIAAEQKGRA